MFFQKNDFDKEHKNTQKTCKYRPNPSELTKKGHYFDKILTQDKCIALSFESAPLQILIRVLTPLGSIDN